MARSVIASAQRCLNLTAEEMPHGQGEPAQFAYYPAPGLRLLGTLPQGPVRAIKQCTTGDVYAVGGDTVYLLDANWSATDIGTISALRPYPVSMQDNGNTMVIVDGTSGGWTVDLASHAFAPIPSVTPPTGAVLKSGAFSAIEQSGLLTTLRGIHDGSFSITVNATKLNVPPMNFASIPDLGTVAEMITGAGDTLIVGFDYGTGVFTLTTAKKGLGASLSYAGAPASGTDISATLRLTEGTKASVPLSGRDVSPFYGADRVDYLDTYLLFNKPGTPQFYSSDSLATTFDPLWWANKESFSDLLVTLAVAKREIWLLGDRTTEVWANVGAADFPFQQVGGVFVEHGCCAKYSVATYDDTVYWLSADRAGQGIVLSGAGYQTKKVSTFAIEAELTKYPKISDAIGMMYSLAGHTFYVLTFPSGDHTWVYDLMSGQWHEWLWIDNNGHEHRHRANCMYACNGVVVAGDWQNGNLYAVETTALTDNGQPIKRQRSFPHILNEMDRVFYRQFVADIECGNPPGPPVDARSTLLSCSFTAPDGTLLESYDNSNDTLAMWTLLSGTSGKIEGNRFAGVAGGSDLYQSPPISVPDYTLQFRAIPTGYTGVATANNFVIVRSAGAGTGYRATVSGDGTQYWVSFGVEGGASTALAMGTIPSGWFIVTVDLAGPQITLKVQRNSDNQYLQPSGVWGAAAVPAVSLRDSTYPAAGSILIGGAWSVPPPSLSYTMETPLASDPNFPSGWSYQDANGGQAFDFGRNRYYHAISGTVGGSGVGGLAITDLNSMGAIRTVTLAQMYAGTPYGNPAGSPPSQSVFGLSSGKNTDLYMLMDNGLGHGVAGEFCRFTRVDPVTMKVTGEFYSSAAFPPPIVCVMPGGWQSGIVNTTASHTIVLYPINGAQLKGPELFDGTGMAPIGLGPTPRAQAYNCMYCAGMRHTDGSCDFIMMDPDLATVSGAIDIWRINVSDSLVITSTKTGTLSVLPYFTPPASADRLFVGQIEYDPVHDTMIVTVPVATTGNTANSAPSWLLSVNYDGTVNWSQYQPTIGGSVYSNAQSDLSNGTYMAGNSNNLHLYDTTTGAVTFTGSILVGGTSAGSYFHVWDSVRSSYWTYALSRGFVRIDAHIPPSLALDNLLATAPATTTGRLIWLDWSDDRAHSWGNPVSQPIGERGEYLTSVQFQRLGMARDRVFRLTWSAPVATALQGAFIELDTSAKS